MLTIEVKSCVDDEHVKCPRCWRYHRILDNYDGLCDRCQEVLLEHWPDHSSIPGIKAALKMQKEKWSVKS